jgi:diguanylate cyclase (GGDEF)-like protein
MEMILTRSDFLTRLANRASFLEGVEKELKRCQREGRSLTVMMIDLDNFKHFNETRGHSVGDLLLSAMADLLRESFRSTDIIARTGDDEFTLVLPGISTDVSESKLQALRKDLEDLFMTRGWKLTFGMAAIALVRPAISGEQIVSEIEHLMQQVKQSTRIGLALQPLSIKMPEPEMPAGLEKQPC